MYVLVMAHSLHQVGWYGSIVNYEIANVISSHKNIHIQATNESSS